ncbi:Prefoldin [Scheffersomyces xylosifermentans]|uniref:Prefoldin n=1 Tax=Scheffersomyces xylosifermentans TaxID=1304137 RepID=UPI00315C79F4
MADKSQFEKLSLEFNEQQNTLNDLISTRSQLETQYQENKIVLNEFDSLNDESKIYKLTGPILVPQEFAEAKLNVTKRIEFIEDEIKRAETKISEEEKKIEGTREKLLAIRASMGA